MLVAQYDGYVPIEGLHVNGRLTLGENIGDLSGLTIAYAAYQRFAERKARARARRFHRRSAILPGLCPNLARKAP